MKIEWNEKNQILARIQAKESVIREIKIGLERDRADLKHLEEMEKLIGANPPTCATTRIKK